MGEIIFDCELDNSKWTGKIKLKEVNNKSCIADVEARGTCFTVVITCYFEGFGMREWCMCVPTHNFGCKISAISSEWNEEQFTPYIKNRVDRRSLVCAVEAILKEVSNETEI